MKLAYTMLALLPSGVKRETTLLDYRDHTPITPRHWANE